MARQREAERLPLDRETAILRQELSEMTSEEEVSEKHVGRLSELHCKVRSTPISGPVYTPDIHHQDNESARIILR